MKKQTKYFIYFILIAPVLSKIIEWLFQYVTYNGWNHLANGVWLEQIFFILLISFSSYLLIFNLFDVKKTPKKLAIIVGLSYLLKEVYNLIFVYQSFNIATFIALTIEPFFMYVVIGLNLPKLFFKEN